VSASECASLSASECASLRALAHSQTRRAEHTIEAERRRLADEKKSLEEALRTAQRELGQVCISLQVLIASGLRLDRELGQVCCASHLLANLHRLMAMQGR
jgi:seryl-tRNA synthetase